MKKLKELQGMNIVKFNSLMTRLNKFSPNWANHIKSNKNKNTITNKMIIKEYREEGGFEHLDDQEMLNDLNHHIYRKEYFITKENKRYDIVESDCCVVGEYFNGNVYKHGSEWDNEEKSECTECNNYCASILRQKGDNSISGILDLDQLNQLILHWEEETK